MRIEFNPNQPNFLQKNSVAERKEDLPATENTAEKNPVTQKRNKSGSAITIAALASVGCVFMLSRGTQKSAGTILNKIKTFLEKRSARSSFKESGKWKKFYEFSIRRINSFIKKSESINNITSLKDILFMKLMYKTEPTKKIHQAITNYFDKISHITVEKSYEKTKVYFERMNKAFDELDKYILKNFADEKVKIEELGKDFTKRELVDMARNNRELTSMAIGAFIDKSTIKGRREYINNLTSSLYSDFWNESFKDFWSKNNKFKRKEMWQTFIAADQIKGNKSHFSDGMFVIKNAVTYTEKNETRTILEYIKALDNIVPEKDKEGIEIIKKLEWFVKNPEIYNNSKEMFLEELEKLNNHKFPLKINNKTAQALDDYKKKNIETIKWQIKDNRAGLLQEMLSYYYKMAPYELEKTGALMSLKRAVKSIEDSVRLESVEYFDKVRDLRLGSAPTDILTILFSFIALSLGLGHAKDNDTRTSVMLKSGIPIVGGIAAAMYSTTKLVSGGKSLAFGLLSGIILNRLGIIADNFRKNRELKLTQNNALDTKISGLAHSIDLPKT